MPYVHDVSKANIRKDICGTADRLMPFPENRARQRKTGIIGNKQSTDNDLCSKCREIMERAIKGVIPIHVNDVKNDLWRPTPITAGWLNLEEFNSKGRLAIAEGHFPEALA